MAELHSVEAAQKWALSLIQPLGCERVLLESAFDRVLAEPVVATCDLPPDDNSAMDGVAVRFSDVVNPPVELEILGEIAAGRVASVGIEQGQCYRIMTGAAMPLHADAVVMVEHTEERGEKVAVLRAPKRGEHVRLHGSDVARGTQVLAPGTRLGAGEIAMCAALSRVSLPVVRRPFVAILSTGDELCALDEPVTPGKISDSNSYALATLVRAAGGQPQLHPIVRDQPEAVRAAMLQAQRADLIVSSGGVSVGKHDHVKRVLEELGGKIHLWRVAMKPGKPLVLGALRQTPYFGLPGNPASAMVSFSLFVRPAIRHALGMSEPFDPLRFAILTDRLVASGDRRHYLRSQLHWGQGELKVTPLGNQSSGALSSLVNASGLIVLEPGVHDLAPGTRVQVLPFGTGAV